jgi:hypothetical protein
MTLIKPMEIAVVPSNRKTRKGSRKDSKLPTVSELID